uniref:PlxyGVORF66 protein n=1 Tax=Plutella xylostella granulovirus TaxID=98383 RepID=A0A1B2CSG5_9BBAC|nr:PlxyGVORF66 protein [Plutella xylostella granulovirus]
MTMISFICKMSGRIRLFLAIENLKKALDDEQMRLPYYEQFFPLLGNANTINLNVQMLQDLMNDAAVAAQNVMVTRGGAVYAQYVNNAPEPAAPNTVLPPPRRLAAPVPSTVVTDVSKYLSYAEKIMTYFVSAGVTSTTYRVRDIIMLYIYVYSLDKYRPLYKVLENILFTTEKQCVPCFGENDLGPLLDNIRELTGINNIRLDFESVVSSLAFINKSVFNELSKFPIVKVKNTTDVIVYNNETDPCKVIVDKFTLLIGENVQYFHEAKNSEHILIKNPLVIENIAINIEKSSDINRMVYNAVNNIFINTVEQCAAENVKFNVSDYNKRFQFLKRVRESRKHNVVEKVAVGDVSVKPKSRSPTSDIK